MMNHTSNGTPDQVLYWLIVLILHKNLYAPCWINLKSVIFFFSFVFISGTIQAQCETEVSGIFTYCNSFDNGQLVSGYFVGFRVSIPNGDTLNVIDLNDNVPDNQGKRIDDINTQQEPLNISVQQLMVSGVGSDTLEFWYFGPYANNDTFNIALVDPDGDCDTLFVASGTYTCEDHSGTSDPGACDNNVPLYFFDFSQTEFIYGGGGGGNENNDAFFLVMQRSRENFCCDLQPLNQRCFEFILRLGEDDIGLSIDDVGNGTPGGELYADTLNLFNCTGNSDMTWPLTQGGGQSQDAPLCLTGDLSRDFIVLSCKSGSNVTGVSIDALSEINVPPAATWENCSVTLNVLHADTAIWTSVDDPNLDNLLSCAGDSIYCEFFYNAMVFGEITACEGDTFTYFVGGTPADNGCFPSDTILFDTTYVIVYPAFFVEIDSMCNFEGDSIILTAAITSTGIGCNYDFNWSTGDTTQSITVPLVDSVYSITVNRSDILRSQQNCPIGSDFINVSASPVLVCENLEDGLYSCISDLPLPDVTDVVVVGCSISPLLFVEDEGNDGSGCRLDTLMISRYYIVDFDGDTINTTSDQATCIQRFMYVDDQAPTVVGGCPNDTSVDCSTVNLSFLLPSEYIDNCTNEEEIIITYRDDTLSGFDGSCIDFTTGMVRRTWFAQDTCGNVDSACIQLIYFIDTIPPVINFCPADVHLECDASVDVSVLGMATATDNCDVRPMLLWSDVLTPGICMYNFTITRRWIAYDHCMNSDTCFQLISVQDTVHPVILCPANITVGCAIETSPEISGYATATDNCDGMPDITWSDTIIAGNCPQTYTISRRWVATDICFNSDTCYQVIQVRDTISPIIICPSDTILNCLSGTTPDYTSNAISTDGCGDPAPSVSWSDVTISGGCPQEYSISRRWIAIDDCFNSDTCYQSILVQDTIRPEWLTPHGILDTLVECTDSTGLLIAQSLFPIAFDNCDPDVANPLKISGPFVAGSCPAEGVYTNTWTVVDHCGNISEVYTQVITIIDTNGPAISCPPDITVIFPASTLPSNTGSAFALDNCDPSPAISYTDSIPPGPCPEVNYVIRNWIATDACGNTNQCQQQIIIDDHGSICGTVSDNLGEAIAGMEVFLMADLNSNQILDMGDTLVAIVFSDTVSGNYCFDDIWPCDYIIIENQPIDYFDIYDYDFTPDPDGNDSLDGPDNEIPVYLAQGESDLQNNFINVICPIILPLIPPDTICEGGSVVLEIEDLDLGDLAYAWDFGSGSDPASGNGLGPHTISYITTSENQSGGAIIALTISKEDCPDLTGQVSTVEINPYPDPSINGSTATGCYYSERIFQPMQPEIPGANYEWNFGIAAIPATATGYGPHTVYYTSVGSKSVKLVIYPNETGSQCPDSSTIVFNIISCPSQILGRVVTDNNEPISGVNIRLYSDTDTNGVADNGSAIRSVYTTSTGFYSMTSLIPGHYVLVQTQPAGWFSVDDYDATEDGDIVPNSDSHDNVIPTSLIPSEVDSFNVFVETALPGTISGTVFVDFDSDLLPDPGEGLAGVEIMLFVDADINGVADTIVPLTSQNTNTNGEYIMTSIPVGHYVLVENQPACYLSVKDYDSSNDADEVPNSNMQNDTIPVTISNGEIDAHNYFIDLHANTLWVENTNDNGAGSLREVLDCSESGDTVLFHPSLAGQIIQINSTDIDIHNDVIIYSALTPRLTIASETIGLFSIHAGTTAEFRGMDIISGLSPENMGAAFYNLGVLKLDLVSVFRNINLQSGHYLIRNESGSEMYISGNCFIEMD